MEQWKTEKQILIEEIQEGIAALEAQSPPKGSDSEFQLSILKRELKKLQNDD